MAEIKYVGSSVNSAVNQLTTVSGRFQPVANNVKTKTGVDVKDLIILVQVLVLIFIVEL